MNFRYGLLLPAMLAALLLAGSAAIPRVYAPTVITFDAAVSAYCAWGTCGPTLSWSHTVGSGSSRILVVGVSINDPGTGVLSVSYGASSLTLITSPKNQMSMYYLLNPPIGTLTVTVTFTGTPGRAAGGSVSYFNVYDVGPSSSTGGGGSVASVSVGSNDGELVVDLLGAGTNAAPIAAGSGQALRWAEPAVGAMSDKTASSPTTTMTYTLAGGAYTGGWDMIAVVLLPGTKAPVGGVVLPTSKLEIATPLAALAGLIVAVSAVVAVKRRRD